MAVPIEGDSNDSVPGVRGGSAYDDDAVRAVNTSTGKGLYASSASGDGIHAYANSGRSAIYAENYGGSGICPALSAVSYNTHGDYGTVYAVNLSTGYAIKAYSSGFTAIYGSTGSTVAAVAGFSANTYGTAIRGSTAGDASISVDAYASGDNSYALQAENAGGGVNAHAAVLIGTVSVFGDFVVPSEYDKEFVMDHPLDPANRYLFHVCIESSERKNIYDGVGIADHAGELVVELPAYFEALNGEFRYLVAPFAGPAPDLHILREISGNKFAIGGAKPGQKISWQVTGIRKSPSPFAAERDKHATHRGRYVSPAAHGQPPSAGIYYREPKPHEAPDDANRKDAST